MDVVVRLTVPAMRTPAELCRFRLAWQSAKEGSRVELVCALELPVLRKAAWEALPVQREVQERSVLLLIARFKREATRCRAIRDREGALRWLQEARRVLSSIPQTTETARESEALSLLERHFAEESWEKFDKMAKFQAHQQRHGKA